MQIKNNWAVAEYLKGKSMSKIELRAVLLLTFSSSISVPTCLLLFYRPKMPITIGVILNCIEWVIPFLCMILCALFLWLSRKNPDYSDAFYCLERIATLLFGLFLAQSALSQVFLGLGLFVPILSLFALSGLLSLIPTIVLFIKLSDTDTEPDVNTIVFSGLLSLMAFFCFAVSSPLLFADPPQPSIGLISFSACFLLLFLQLLVDRQRYHD